MIRELKDLFACYLNWLQQRRGGVEFLNKHE